MEAPQNAHDPIVGPPKNRLSSWSVNVRSLTKSSMLQGSTVPYRSLKNFDEFRVRRYSNPVLKLCLPWLIETSSLYWNWFSVKNCGIPAVAPKLVPIGSTKVAIDGIPTASGDVKLATRRR